MPSSKKTPNLLLNNWQGYDKPKKDDFVEDNEIIDRSFHLVQSRVASLEEAQQALKEEIGDDFAATIGAIDGRIGNVAAAAAEADRKAVAAMDDLNIHAGNTGAHVSAQDRAAWNNMRPVVGTYTGLGTISQKIVLGFAPSFGFVYAVGRPMVNVSWDFMYVQMYSATLCRLGSSLGVKAEDDGFTVYTMGPSNDNQLQDLNNDDYTYVYIMWP